jgi:double-strand break repair protein MRE11
VDYSPSSTTSFEVGNPQRFGQDFLDRVANPKDVVQFHRKKAQARKAIRPDQPEGMMALDDESEEVRERIEKIKVETFINQYLEAQNLLVLPQNGLQRAVEDFVDKDDTTAIKTYAFSFT